VKRSKKIHLWTTKERDKNHLGGKKIDFQLKEKTKNKHEMMYFFLKKKYAIETMKTLSSQ